MRTIGLGHIDPVPILSGRADVEPEMAKRLKSPATLPDYKGDISEGNAHGFQLDLAVTEVATLVNGHVDGTLWRYDKIWGTNQLFVG